MMGILSFQSFNTRNQFLSKMNLAVFVVVCTSTLMAASPSWAVRSHTCHTYTEPLNQSFKENRKWIFEDIQNGCPPPDPWTHAEGKEGSGLIGMSGTTGFVNLNTSNRAASSPLRYYKGACNSYDDTRAGGFTDQGADTPCKKGNGTGLFNFNILGHFPWQTLEAMQCLGNLAAAISGGLSGTPTGDFGGIKTSGKVSGNCASGSIGICGLGSIGGSICANGKGKPNDKTTVAGTNNGQPYSSNDPAKYVEITEVAIFDYANTKINQNSAVYCPTGCVLTYKGTNYTIEVGGGATMDPTGTLFILTKDGGSYANPVKGIKLNPDEPVSIAPKEGVIQVADKLLSGETIGIPVNLATVGTIQGENAATGQQAQMNVSYEPSTGATPVPDPAWGIKNPLVAGAFPPIGTITPDIAPTPTILPGAAQAESGIVQ
jgi:hypothetical protein